MAAITLTPVDSSTAAVVVNSEIIYHVFTINGVTRVFYGKGGKSPYQVDVQESAASIAAASPNLIEVTTANGAEYLFIGSGGTGPGKGIMFIEADGSGSKITFRYVEESNPILVYSSDSPSVLAGRINAAASTTVASYEALTQTTSFNTAVTMSSNKAFITTMTWSSSGPVQDGFNVVNPLIGPASILNVYISDESTPTQAFLNVVKNTGSCDLWFSVITVGAFSVSFNVVVEVIN